LRTQRFLYNLNNIIAITATAIINIPPEKYIMPMPLTSASGAAENEVSFPDINGPVLTIRLTAGTKK
jgi:hypothetical protein